MKKLIYIALSIIAVFVMFATIENAPIIALVAVTVEFFAMRQANK